MLTDPPPRKKNRELFGHSDRLKTLALPGDGRLPRIAETIESAMKSDAIADVRRACAKFLTTASDFYQVRTCAVRVLAARPMRVREHSAIELFGDYHPTTMLSSPDGPPDLGDQLPVQTVPTHHGFRRDRKEGLLPCGPKSTNGDPEELVERSSLGRGCRRLRTASC